MSGFGIEPPKKPDHPTPTGEPITDYQSARHDSFAKRESFYATMQAKKLIDDAATKERVKQITSSLDTDELPPPTPYHQALSEMSDATGKIADEKAAEYVRARDEAISKRREAMPHIEDKQLAQDFIDDVLGEQRPPSPTDSTTHI